MFSDGHLAISPKGDLALAILVAGNSDKKAWFSRKSGAAVALRIDGKKVIKVGEIGVGGLAEGVAFSADGDYKAARGHVERHLPPMVHVRAQRQR